MESLYLQFLHIEIILYKDMLFALFGGAHEDQILGSARRMRKVSLPG